MDFLRTVTAIFYPERCPYCNALIEPCEIACASCYDDLRHKHLALPSGARGFRCVSSFVYDGRVRRMIIRLKFRGRTQYVPQIAEILADDIRLTYGEGAFDLITAVPMHPVDQHNREYNQSVLLAKALGKLLDLPYADILRKVKRTKKQHTLSYADRKTNLNGAFQLIDPEAVRDKRILIIDDIITSGYTLSKCCQVIARGKPQRICCATIANAKDKYPKATVI